MSKTDDAATRNQATEPPSQTAAPPPSAAAPAEQAPEREWYLNHSTSGFTLKDGTLYPPGKTRQLDPFDVERLRRRRAITRVDPPTGGNS